MQRNLLEAYIEQDYERNIPDPARDKDANKTNKTGMDGDMTVITPHAFRIKFGNLRVLAEQSATLAPFRLQPYDELQNPEGVRYQDVRVPLYVAFGERDAMMCANQRFMFINACPNTKVHVRAFARADHFVEQDVPDDVAEWLVTSIRAHVGPNGLAQVFAGFEGIWHGNEEESLNMLNAMYPYNP